MKSFIRIIIGVLTIIAVFISTFFIYNNLGRDVAVLYNLSFFGVWCSVVARTKKRNSFGWFFIGFFGGVVGLAFILAVKTNEQASERV
jgi:hypothetical protein